MDSHGSQQGVVMEGPFRYCGNIIAVEAAGGWKRKKTEQKTHTHMSSCGRNARNQTTASEIVAKRVETRTSYAECQHLVLKYVC